MLDDKTVIVGGGGRGLGEATAIELGRVGANVVVNDLGTDTRGEGQSKKPAETTATAVEQVGGDAMAHFGDVSSLSYTEELIMETVSEYGRVDGIVNFAGILRDSISYKMTEEEWDAVIRVHLRGHFSLFRNAAAHWRECARDRVDELEPQRSFLSISSTSALGNVGQLNYSAAKAGVLGLTRTGARELYRHNVRVNALMPIGITRMNEDLESMQENEKRLPPEKVSPIVAFLMSEHAKDVTGCTFRAVGNMLGLMSDPEICGRAYQKGGWTPWEIVELFDQELRNDYQLDKVSTES
jgi:NAD(P)-dependent dehydrogenase (short-subunit alcohol dehydrogenase family)